jgi:hypothetical protein
MCAGSQSTAGANLHLSPSALSGLDRPEGFAKAVISMAALVSPLHPVRTRLLRIPAAMTARFALYIVQIRAGDLQTDVIAQHPHHKHLDSE